MSGEELYLETRDSEDESPSEEPDFLPIDPTVAQPDAKSLLETPRAKDGRSHWGAHKLFKGSVRQFQRGNVGFCGHKKIVALIVAAKSIGDAKYPVTGDRDAALVAAYFLTGGRRNEIIKNITRPDKDGDTFWYGLRKSDIVLGKELHRVTLRILKQYETEEILKDGDKRKLVTKREVLNREFPVMSDEVELPYLLTWMKTIPDGQYLFEMSRASAYKVIREAGKVVEGSSYDPTPKGWKTHWFVHRLRYERASFLRSIGYRPDQLMDYFAWRRIEEALRYGATNFDDKVTVLKDLWAKRKEGQK